MIRQLLLTVFVLAAVTATVARAHTVWIEPKDSQLLIRFAEPGNDFETSPGYLDNLSGPVAFIVASNAPSAIEASRKADHFLLLGATPTNTTCLETIFTVRGGRKPHFYARWQPTAAGAVKPLLTLDLVPTGKPGEARAYFRGQPLGGIKATLRTPDEKELEVTADADGFLRFETKSSGAYLLTIAHHRENVAGFHGGRPYEQTSHNAALSWQQP